MIRPQSHNPSLPHGRSNAGFGSAFMDAYEVFFQCDVPNVIDIYETLAYKVIVHGYMFQSSIDFLL